MRDEFGFSTPGAQPTPSTHMAARPCAKLASDSIQLKPATPGGDVFVRAHVAFGGLDRLGPIGQDVAFRIEEFAAVIEKIVGPQRHVGVLQAAPDVAVDARFFVGEFGCEFVHLVERLGHRDLVLLKDFLVVVEDEVVDRPSAATASAPCRFWRMAMPAAVKSLSRRSGAVRFASFMNGVMSCQPAGLLELPLLHVIAQGA